MRRIIGLRERQAVVGPRDQGESRPNDRNQQKSGGQKAPEPLFARADKQQDESHKNKKSEEIELRVLAVREAVQCMVTLGPGNHGQKQRDQYHEHPTDQDERRRSIIKNRSSLRSTPAHLNVLSSRCSLRWMRGAGQNAA